MTEPIQQTLPTMSDSQKLLALALCLKAIDDAYEELTEFKASIKSRIETLLKESRAIRYEILSGQERLPLEGTCVTPVVSNAVPSTECRDAAASSAQTQRAGMTKTTNSMTGTTTTSQRNPDETSVEEHLRTRAAKPRKKVLGPEAPPDKRTEFPGPEVQP